MPQPLHHPSYYTPGLGPGGQGCQGWCTTSPPVVSILANHPPSSLDWRRSPGYTPWWGTGLYNWLHDAASNACRSHNPSPIPSLDHIYDFSSEFSWCWHWIQHNVGLCCLLLDMVNTGGSKLGNLSHTLNYSLFCGVYCPMDFSLYQLWPGCSDAADTPETDTGRNHQDQVAAVAVCAELSELSANLDFFSS